MNVMDRARLEAAVYSYGFWLDLRGVPRRQRRNLRRELRANLLDASAQRGARAAVAALGGTRRMAADGPALDPRRPRWNAGATAGLCAASIVLLIEFFAALGWADGAMAASKDKAVHGPLTLFPGSALTYDPAPRSLTISLQPGWGALAVGLAVFVLVARPWRLATGRRSPAPAQP